MKLDNVIVTVAESEQSELQTILVVCLLFY